MSALEFCEECQVYHHTALIDGQQAFTECERYIPAHLTAHCPLTPHKNQTVKQQDLSPISRSSFTSINYHIAPQINRNSHFVSYGDTTMVSNSNRPVLSQASPNLNYGTPQKMVSPPVQISFLPVKHPEPVKSTIQARKVQGKLTSPTLSMNLGRTLLSTIVEERYDGTDRSLYTSQQVSARNSKRGSLNDQLPTEVDSLTLAQKFAEVRMTQDQVIGPVNRSTYVFRKLKKYNVDNSHLQEQKNCWCW